jgi:uncharacterized protein YhfF
VTFPVVNDLRTIEFGTSGDSRSRLIDFVMRGNKRATAGLLHDYEKEGEPVEFVGECLAMVDNDGIHVATLRVVRTEISRFADVPDEFALAEAEGDLNAADFRASHLSYWTGAGETISDDTQVVQVYFELLPLLLRPLQPSDAEWIHRACQDPEIQRWTVVPRPYTLDHAKEFISGSTGERIVRVIHDVNHSEPVGVASIHQIENGVATVGYWVAPWGRRRGAASTALLTLASIATRIEGTHTLRAEIAETNSASQATAERAGLSIREMGEKKCPDGDKQVRGLIFERKLGNSQAAH